MLRGEFASVPVTCHPHSKEESFLCSGRSLSLLGARGSSPLANRKARTPGQTRFDQAEGVQADSLVVGIHAKTKEYRAYNGESRAAHCRKSGHCTLRSAREVVILGFHS